jgi:hypothetical protein
MALRPAYTEGTGGRSLAVRQERKKPASEGCIFASRSGGFIDAQNYWKKMRKLGKDLLLPKLTVQVIGPLPYHGGPRSSRGFVFKCRLYADDPVFVAI